MARPVLATFTSLDGYVEGPGGAFVPPAWSDEPERRWSGHELARAGHPIYGRRSFLFNKGFWEAAEIDPGGPAAAIAYAGTMNRLPETVFSTTLSGDPGWNGTLARGDLPGVAARLKAEVRGEVLTFGGAGIANALVALDLVDEYRLMAAPNLLGEGKRPFEGGRPRLDLALVESRPLDTGAVILHHRRDRAA